MSNEHISYSVFLWFNNHWEFVNPPWAQAYFTKDQINHQVSLMIKYNLKYRVSKFVTVTSDVSLDFPEKDYKLSEEIPDIPKMLMEP